MKANHAFDSRNAFRQASQHQPAMRSPMAKICRTLVEMIVHR
jgi:hypothetical protein